MNKLAIITGGSGYLGSAIAERFKQKGYAPVSFSTKGGVDVTDELALKKAIDAAVDKYGPIYACVHAAAAPLERKSLLSIASDSFDKAMAVAAGGAYLLARAAAPHMDPSATFIGITTEAIEPSELVSPSGAYIPAKYALRGVLRALNAELPRVYAVAPGFLPGGLNGDLPEAVRAVLAQKYKSPTPEDIAALVVDLCEGSAIPSGSSVLIDRTYSAL